MYISDNDINFANQFSEFVNGKMRSPRAVAVKMATDHPYLQQEMFKVAWEYIKVLSTMSGTWREDGRNQWACQTAKRIVDALDEAPTQSWIDDVEELRKAIGRR